MPEASEISWAMLERESLLASSSIQRCPSISGQLAGETVAELGSQLNDGRSVPGMGTADRRGSARLTLAPTIDEPHGTRRAVAVRADHNPPPAGGFVSRLALRSGRIGKSSLMPSDR
jgi:hypothetical protein